MTSFNCQACGESINLKESDDTARCGGCGTSYTFEDGTPEIERSPIPEDEHTGPRPTPTTDGADDEPGDVELVDFRISLPKAHVDDLQRDGRAPEQSIHRAIRLYREMDNADELIAEDDWRRVSAGD